MTNAQKLLLRISEIKSRLNVITGLSEEDFSDEVRAESEKLTAEYSATEIRWRAAEIAEADESEKRKALEPD